MNANDLLLRNWDACHDKEDWYPPLADALNGLTAEQADWHPAGEHANTIRETVHHLIFYKERLLRRLTGEETAYLPGVTNDDTFAARPGEPEDWHAAAARLAEVHQAIRDRIAAWNEHDFERQLPGQRLPFGIWANSLALHDAYHTGQIILIRKLQGSWPSHRSFD
ncbi:DinB family protein [Paenibacillus sp. MWE-103]|uniref:DinB family protein n=1 Tax=Paenibacillus artemisiicola TaxID=1172618 RepID=A0ABS3W3E7_9BACL|nr:DinB family protein [Paenibacillus artemisiicola]MBO7742721.1 DinB family protein [Paenibacillus artemisiicola]